MGGSCGEMPLSGAGFGTVADWSATTTKPDDRGTPSGAIADIDADHALCILDSLSRDTLADPPASPDADAIKQKPDGIKFKTLPGSVVPGAKPPASSDLSHLSADVQGVLRGQQTFQRTCSGRSLVVIKAMTDPAYAKRVAADPAWAAKEEHRLVTQYGGGARPEAKYQNDVAGNRRDDPDAEQQGRGLEHNQTVAMVTAETGKPHYLGKDNFAAPLLNELQAGRPVMVMSMGHAMVATGTHKGEDGKTYVSIYNPMNGTVTDVDLEDMMNQDLGAAAGLAQKYPNLAVGGCLPIVMAVLPGEAPPAAKGE